ncbi:hypothetical protein N9E25_07325 [Verrucomicrobiales bacterium]|nr:hypothetical protein [Verrucomicrobiales bacterium]MDC3353172.1 hypothetical protein [Verrucomicrobiales bacterium]
MNTLEAAFGQLPEPILNKLDLMIRRIRRLLFLRGLFATLAVAFGCLLAIMAIDAAFTLFSTTSRWILSLTGLAITAIAAWWFLARPLSRRFTLTHMARILEIRHPELQERISTAVELLSSDDPESIKGSEELISAVVDSAVDDVETVEPNTEFKPAKTNRYLLIAVVFASIIAATLLIWPKQSWTLMTRALAPFLDIGNAYADSLVIDPGDVRIAKGSTVTVEMSVGHKRLRRAEIRRLQGDGKESIERMTLIGEEDDGTKHFSLTFPNVEEGFQYRVRAGAALSRYFTVETVEPPVVDGLTIRYDYPEYTGLNSKTEQTETGEIRAVNHTRVTLTAVVNKPVQSSKMILNSSREMPAPTVNGNELSWKFELLAGMNGNWHLELSDLDGFSNSPISFPLEVLPDKAPTVQITHPILRELSLRPTEQLDIAADVTEDFGFSDVALIITPDGAPESLEQKQKLPTSIAGPGAYASTARLDLAALRIRPEQKRLAVQMRVSDNRPEDYDGPGVGFSETIYINISKSAKSLADQAIDQQKKEVRENLEEAKRELEHARDDMRRVEQEVSRSDEVSPEARKQLEEFSQRTETARDRLDEVAAMLDQGLFQEQSDTAEKLANETIAEAREKADLVPMTDGRKERQKEANQARQKVEEAIREIDKLSRSMREADKDYEAISKLNDIANKQQELAMQADQMAEEARQKMQEARQNADEQAAKRLEQQQQQQMDRFQDEQNRVQQELGQMLKDNAAALNEILAEQQEEASALSEEAAGLAEEQKELREMNQAVLQAKDKKKEALKKELLERLEEEQAKLAEETSRTAQQEAANEESQSQSEQSSQSEQATPQMANADQQQSENAGEKSDQSPSAGNNDSSQPENASNPNATPQNAEGENAEAQAQGNTEKKMPQTPAEQLAEAAQQASEAAEQLGEENLEGASESASQASETLAEAAEQSSQESYEPSSEERGQEGEMASAENQSGESGQKDSSQQAAASESEQSPSDGSAEGDQGEPGSPPASPKELAARQEALAEQIEAVRQGQLQEALAMMEEELAAEAAELQNQAEAFEEAMSNLSQRSAQSGADRAEQALQRGSDKASDASQQMAQAQQQQSNAEQQETVEEGELANDAQSSMRRGQSEQQQSQNHLSQAAQAMGQTSQAIGKTMQGLEPSDADERIADSKDLANGFEEMAESAQSQDAQQAAQKSQEAANAMQQLARTAMSKLGQQGNTPPGQQDQQPQPPQELTGDPTSEELNETGLKAADANGNGVPPELQQLGISVEDWARFKGALVGGNATAIETELPAEYRELVGRYFQVIAKEAGKKK